MEFDCLDFTILRCKIRCMHSGTQGEEIPNCLSLSKLSRYWAKEEVAASVFQWKGIIPTNKWATWVKTLNSTCRNLKILHLGKWILYYQLHHRCPSFHTTFSTVYRMDVSTNEKTTRDEHLFQCTSGKERLAHSKKAICFKFMPQILRPEFGPVMKPHNY